MKILSKYSGTLDDGEIPEIVYKYRSWDSDFHKRFIFNREVFMASPFSFEDEFDCKIPLRHDLMSKDQLMEYAIHWTKFGSPYWNRQQHRKEAHKLIREKYFQTKKYLVEFRQNYFNQLNERLGILSLTAKPCNSDMWTKYADNHQGICIGYNSRIMFEYLGGGGAVHYVDNLPIIFPEPIMSHDESRTTQVFCKLKKWEFEKEYRTMNFWDFPTQESDRRKVLPKEAFNSIILGKHISNQAKLEISQAVKANIGEIPILEYNNVC